MKSVICNLLNFVAIDLHLQFVKFKKNDVHNLVKIYLEHTCMYYRLDYGTLLRVFFPFLLFYIRKF